MNVLRSLTLIIPLLLLSGCASLWPFGSDPVQPVVVETKAIERSPLNLPDPTPLKPSDLKWIVITPENAEKVWADLEKNGNDLVLFAVTDNGYESLAVTMMEIRNFIDKQKTIIVKYREYYEPSEE